jgi:hypothetical protein
MKALVAIAFALAFFICYSHPGVGIVMDSQGNVFYTDLKHVWKIDVQGRKSVAVRNVHTHELYMDQDDNLFGEHLWYNGEKLDTWGHYVWRYSAAGKFEKIIPDKEGFLTDYSFVRDHYGNMFWADRTHDCQKLARTNPDGTLSLMGDQCFKNIRWMTASPQGNVYLIDLYDLKNVDRQGHVKTLAVQLQERKLTQFFVNDPHQLMGLTTDKNENVFVAVYGGRKVKKITPGGQVFTVAETGLNWSPTGVLSAPNGDLWILECSPTNAVRVERITHDGQRIVY